MFLRQSWRPDTAVLMRCSTTAVVWCAIRRKRSGKPLDTPPYEQAYLPYDIPPTQAEMDRERRRFAQARRGDKVYDVKDLPQNMYTYGKEGMTVPISIFKDQPDPVIGPEHTYPLIYENKIAAKNVPSSTLLRMAAQGNFESPLQEDVLEERITEAVAMAQFRLRILTNSEHHPFLNERKAQKPRGKGAGAKSQPAAAGGKPAAPTVLRNISGKK